MFDLTGKNAVIVGGAGVLGGSMTKALAQAGAEVYVFSRSLPNAERAAGEADKVGKGGRGARFGQVDAGSRQSLGEAADRVRDAFPRLDILVNAVGGNAPGATTGEKAAFEDLDVAELGKVVELNLFAGAILPCQAFLPLLTAGGGRGSIINVTSVNACRPLTRIPGYSAAKAAVSNFTQWLAVDLAKRFGDRVRVNAICPGFFLTEQNRFLLTEEGTGELTARGRSILSSTPMGRFGEPEELGGALIWLASEASRFVTGAVVPVDGGFTAFSGV
ncbi:MAG: SDR family oxidoreductase [Oscillospiraceae bacterium]|nr:SDR family oxidoreductase [Oscillospiraceae bacterium]